MFPDLRKVVVQQWVIRNLWHLLNNYNRKDCFISHAPASCQWVDQITDVLCSN